MSAEAVGEGEQAIELVDVVAGDHDGEFEVAHTGVGEPSCRPDRRFVGAGAAHRVVGVGIEPIDADLHVEVVHRGDPLRGGFVDERAVRGELHADTVGGRVFDNGEEVAADHRLPAADVHVEHPEFSQFVDEGDRLRGAQFSRIAPPRRR